MRGRDYPSTPFYTDFTSQSKPTYWCYVYGKCRPVVSRPLEVGNTIHIFAYSLTTNWTLTLWNTLGMDVFHLRVSEEGVLIPTNRFNEEITPINGTDLVVHSNQSFILSISVVGKRKVELSLYGQVMGIYSLSSDSPIRVMEIRGSDIEIYSVGVERDYSIPLVERTDTMTVSIHSYSLSISPPL